MSLAWQDFRWGEDRGPSVEDVPPSIRDSLPQAKSLDCKTNRIAIRGSEASHRWGKRSSEPTGPGPALMTSRPLLLYHGRIRLSTTDAGDGLATPADTTYFPTATNLMHSDMRYYCAQGFETGERTVGVPLRAIAA